MVLLNGATVLTAKKWRTIMETKCWGFKKCVTTYRLFGKCCLDKDCLMLSIKEWADVRADEHNFESNNYGKVVYQQFTSGRFRWLGKKTWHVMPSWKVCAVRRKYPGHNSLYMGIEHNIYICIYIYNRFSQ